MENKEQQFGSPMWDEGMQKPSTFERKYPLPSRASRPTGPKPPERTEVKKVEVQKKANGLSIFGKQGYLDKSSLKGKLESRQDFFTDSNIKMDIEQRRKFAEKINKFVSGKTTLNLGDAKIIEKKLREEEFKVKNTPKEFKIKRERAALKKLFDLKQ